MQAGWEGQAALGTMQQNWRLMHARAVAQAWGPEVLPSPAEHIGFELQG